MPQVDTYLFMLSRSPFRAAASLCDRDKLGQLNLSFLVLQTLSVADYQNIRPLRVVVDYSECLDNVKYWAVSKQANKTWLFKYFEHLLKSYKDLYGSSHLFERHLEGFRTNLKIKKGDESKATALTIVHYPRGLRVGHNYEPRVSSISRINTHRYMYAKLKWESFQPPRYLSPSDRPRWLEDVTELVRERWHERNKSNANVY